MTTSTTTSSTSSNNLFAGNSQMHRQIREFNWAESVLGPVEDWPQSLKTAIHIILGSDYPMAIWWGEEMIMFNNDAYMKFMGNKQASSLGRPAKAMWEDIWEVVGPMFHKVLQTGEAWFADKLLLYNERKGFKEEAYFTFSCSPIINENGKVGGIFCTSSEETRQVLSERRLDTLRQIGAISMEEGSLEKVRTELLSILDANNKDISFALLYSYANGACNLNGSTSGAFNTDLHQQPNITNCSVWQLPGELKNLSPVLLENVSVLAPFFKTPDHRVPPQQAFALPIVSSGNEQLSEWLVIGLSPLLELDDQYKDFINLLHTHVNALYANIKAIEYERQRIKKLLELDEAKTTFFSNISHEFRTPITLLLGPVEELLDKGNFSTEEEKQQLETIRRNGLRLLKQVNYLLNFASIESGRANAGYCAIDIGAYTKELSSIFTSVMDRAGLKYTISCDPVSEPVYVDPEMWEKIIFNLLSNAFKFTLEGEVSISLKDKGTEVQLVVQDSGVGIAEEELPHIFNRFHKIKNHCGRSYEGSGIGLSMVAELVKMHHGSITVESTPQQGSTFTITLQKGKEHLLPESINVTEPLLTYTAQQAADNPYLIEASSWLKASDAIVEFSTDAAIAEQAALKQYTVLLVEDNQDMLAYIRRILQPAYRVITATNGLDALQLLEAEQADIVLSDCMMPQVDGLALVQEIRKQPKYSTVPVILLSAQAGEEEKLRGLGIGADDYMTKPFSARELMVRIKSQLYIADLRKQAAQREHQLLLESQALRTELDDILANMSDAFIVLDDELRYTYVNANAGRFTNRSEVDFLGNVIWDVFPDLEGTVFQEKVLESQASRKELNFEFYYPTLDVWYDVRIYPYKHNTAMYICDISAKKRVEQARQESEVRFKVMADAAPVLIWVSAHGSEPIYFNKRWLEYRGKSLEEEQDTGWQEGVHPDDYKLLVKTYEQALEQKSTYEIEVRLKGADGEYRWFLSQGVPRFMPDGTFIGYIGACVDITNRKWAEEILSKYNRDLEERVTQRTSALLKANEQLQEQIAAKKKTQASLARSHEQLRALTTHLQVMREEERKYIARELHDELGQAFTALKIDVSLLIKRLNNSDMEQVSVREELQSMMKTINASIASVREIVAALRPAVLDNFGLMSEIESQAQEFQKRTSIKVNVISDIEYISLTREISIEVFRIIQESMTNIARHANATAVTINVGKSGDNFCFTVADNGVGMQTEILTDIKTFGLLGMQERAERIGADLTFDSEPEHGTQVKLKVPFYHNLPN
ncbi:ATP-binding protein [Pontibacter sp. H249]|uniref:ATP-binding protein n=1 Tax=Pontibacter sp. H249 TaxID=3133420 RepID=UPI0030BEC89D